MNYQRFNNDDPSAINPDALRRRDAIIAEETIVSEIKKNGNKIGLGWFEYDGLFYHIFGRKMIFEKQEKIEVNERDGWFKMESPHRVATFINIGGYTRLIPNVTMEEVIIYPDHFYIYPIPERRLYRLARADMNLITADLVYRLTDEWFAVKSNDVYYITNLEQGNLIAISRSPLMVDESGIYYEENGERKMVNL